MSDVTLSMTGPRSAHPLRGPSRVPIVVVILLGWLSWVHWPAEQVIALLLLLLPQVGGLVERS